MAGSKKETFFLSFFLLLLFISNSIGSAAAF
jgi:hypothetical protein